MVSPRSQEELEKLPAPFEPRSGSTFRRLAPLSGGTIAVLALCGAFVCPALVLAWFWFAPSGVGEYRSSPDDRYEAHVHKMRRGTWAGEIDRYVEFEVVERESGKQIWYVVQRYAADVEPPRYETRGKRFIEWAPDSKSVNVPVAGGRIMTFDLP